VIEFWMGCALLLALAAVFLLFPAVFLRARRVTSQADSNRDWFEHRKAELSADSDSGEGSLLEDARLRVLEDATGSAEIAPTQQDSRPLAIALALLLPLALLAAGLYWQLGAAPDVQLARTLQGFTADSNEEDYRALMLMVEDRAGQRPDNVHYQAMLGRYYMNAADYDRAKALYVRLAEQVPGDASALALAAQASYLAADRQLDTSSQLLAEQALSVDPHQRTALGLLGMVSYEKGQYQAAIGYWRRLLVMEEPDSSGAQMIAGVIARAEAALAGEGPVAAQHAPPAPATATAANNGAGISVRLELAAGSAVKPTDTVFLFARNPALQTRMPVAVQRLTAAELPVTLRLDDSNSMAGQLISQLAQVTIVARVTPGGQPGEEFATLQGELSGVQPDTGEQVHQLLLEPLSTE
jgi:cytochrome c-type biogenesis protein CcmH